MNPLSKGNEAHLCRLMQQVPQHARRAWEQLYHRHQGLIRKLAVSYLCKGISLDDMYQQAILGFRYSCMSYDPQKGEFNTHIGWGIKKYCLKLREQHVKMQDRIKFVSQAEETREQYLNLLAKPRRRMRLNPDQFEQLKRLATACGLRDGDQLILALAFGIGKHRERRRWRRKLWQRWLDTHTKKVCTILTKRILDVKKKTL